MSRYYDSQFDDWDDERDYLESDRLDREDPFEDFGCLFGARCCMPFPHFTSECHTAEMAEEYMSSEGAEVAPFVLPSRQSSKT